MAEPTLELLSAQVEVALEEGDLAAARRMLEASRGRFGEAAEFSRLAAQVEEIARLSSKPAIDELVQRAQERIRVADYQSALEPLRLALELRPAEPELLAILERTEKAAERHAQAVGRQQAAASAARDVTALLNAGDLQTARERLLTARGEHGRQKIFEDLETRLHELIEQAQWRSAEVHLQRARRSANDEDWQSALHQAELALTLAPGDEAAQRLRDEAAHKLEHATSQAQRETVLEEIRHDVERLMAAGEMSRADERLRRAVDALGREELFDELAEAIDKAKKDQEFRRRIEWRERRAREAEALVQEATRRALGNDFAGAIERLTAARELDPSYPDLDAKLATHRAARERQHKSELHASRLEKALAEVRGHLDALRLEAAAKGLREARAHFGEEPRITALGERFEGLREAEALVLPTPENLPSLGLAARAAIRQREAALASAYSWRQAILLPFRDQGPLLLAILTATFLAIHVAASVLAALDVLALAVILMVASSLVRTTLDGKNQAPAIPGLFRGAASLRDMAILAALVGVAALPALGLLVTRDLHSLFVLGLPGWLLLAVALWIGSILVTATSGVALTFGLRRVLRPVSLLGAGPTLVAIAAALLGAVATVLLLRLALVPVMGLPLAALCEAYAVLVLPHMIGLMMRSHRLAWAERYV